jgi:hypothetical protein
LETPIYISQIKKKRGEEGFQSSQVDWHPAQEPYDIPGMN